jgi:trigger factor
MQVTREDLNRCTVRLDIVCAPEEVAQGFDKAYRQISRRLRIPGFRPGMAPKRLVAQVAPREEVLRVAGDNIIRRAVQDAVKQHGLRPHDAPVVDISEFKEDPPECAFVAKVPLAPVVELGPYRDLPARRPRPVALEEEIDRALDELRKRGAHREEVTGRGIVEGDLCLVNINPAGQEGEGRNFMSVAGRTFPGLDAAILGMRAEEMKLADLDFPDTFQDRDWAGKRLSVVVTIRSVSSLTAPELDDEFARQIPEDFASLKSDTLEELRDKVRARIEAVKGEMADEYVEEQLLQSLLEASTVHVPDTMWESVANQRLNDIKEEVAEAGGTMEAYAEERGMTLDELAAKWREQAKLHVERAVVANHIFVREKMVLSNQDLTATLLRMAREYGVGPAVLFEHLKKNKNTTELQTRAIYRKVIEFLRDAARITEVDEFEGAPPAPAAKPRAAPKAGSGEAAGREPETAKGGQG